METLKAHIINGKSLVFPDAFNYQLEDGKKPTLCGNSFTTAILANIATFLHDYPAASREIELYILRWEAHFHFYRTYIVADTIGVRFLPEQAIKLVFIERTQAEGFLKHCLRSH